MQRLLAKFKSFNFNKISDLPPKLDNILKQYGSEIVLFSITVIFSIIYGDYIFFEKSFVHYGFTVDSITQFYPFYALWIDKISTLSFSPWSFQIDLGFNIYTLLVNLNPFDFLLLLAGKEHFVDFLPFVMLLKFVTAGLFFHAFLRQLSISPPLALIGTLLYTFCGYMVINVHWYHYPNYSVLLAVILFLFERWLQTGKWLPLILVLGFLALKAELQIFQFTLFFVVYGGYRLAGMNLLSFKNYGIYLLKAGLLYTVGIAMSSYMLLPSVIKAGAEDRVGEALAHDPLHTRIAQFFSMDTWDHLLVIIGRLFNNDIWGAFGEYSGFLSYFEGPSIYCGLLVVIALPALILLGKQAFRKGHLPLLLLVSLPLIFPQVRDALNFFASATFKYQTLFITTFLLIIVIQVLNQIISEKRGFAFLAASSFGALLFISFFPFDSFTVDAQINSAIIPSIKIFLIIYGACFLSACYRPLRPLLPYLLLLCVFTEASIFNRNSIEQNNGALNTGFSKRGDFYYDNDIRQALSFLKQHDKGFYRVERSFFSGGLNDAMIQEYYGVTGYVGISSGITQFYTTMGYTKYSRRLSSYRYGLRDRVLLHSLLGVKYYLDRNTTPLPGYEFLRSFGDVNLFANNNWLPLGFIQHTRINPDIIKNLPTKQKDHLLLHGYVTSQDQIGISSTNMAAIIGEEFAYPPLDTKKRIKQLRAESFQIKEFSESHLIGEIEANDKGILGWSIPYDGGWHILIDGREVDAISVNYGFLGTVVEKGKHRIELSYTPPFLFIGTAVSIFLLLATLIMYRFYPVIIPVAAEDTLLSGTGK
ncbi:MAG: YfhO family protein [Desulfobulbaceae bacterium]|nr:YfhO family protein [Desulfobulbaceae bacterium]